VARHALRDAERSQRLNQHRRSAAGGQPLRSRFRIDLKEKLAFGRDGFERFSTDLMNRCAQ